MKVQDERRSRAAIEDEALPPELVALLLMCGAEVRAADREPADAANRPESIDRRRPERRGHAAG